MPDQPRDLLNAPDRRDPIPRAFRQQFMASTGNAVQAPQFPLDHVPEGALMLMDRILYAPGTVPIHLGAWPAIFSAILECDPEAVSTAAHLLDQARRNNYTAVHQGRSAQVLTPGPHQEGWNVVAHRQIIPPTAAIPRARYLNVSHYSADEHYTVSPAWRADAFGGPLDNSLASWAEAMPQSRAIGTHRYPIYRVMPQAGHSFAVSPPMEHHEADRACESYGWRAFPLFAPGLAPIDYALAIQIMPTSAIIEWTNSEELYYVHVEPCLHEVRLDPSHARSLSSLRAAMWFTTEAGEVAPSEVADVVAAGASLYGMDTNDSRGMCMRYAYCPAYVPIDEMMALSPCLHTLPAGRRPPPATFRCAVVQIAYVDLYMHLVQEPANCEVAAAVHAEVMAVMKAQQSLHCLDLRIVASHPALAEAAMDRCMPASGSLLAPSFSLRISASMRMILSDYPTRVVTTAAELFDSQTSLTDPEIFTCSCAFCRPHITRASTAFTDSDSESVSPSSD